MRTLPAEEARHKVLLALYQLTTDQRSKYVDTEELRALADVGDAFTDLLRELGSKGRGWLEWRNLRVGITPSGKDKAEELIKMNMAEKERLVLRKIYELGGESHMEWVNIDVLERELSMSRRELFSIINGIENNTNWFGDNPDQAVGLSPAGVKEVESPSSEQKHGREIFTNIFNAPIQGGIQQGGTGNIQNNTYSNNPKVGETADALVKLIQSSAISDLEKEDLIHDIVRLKELGGKDKTPEVADRAKKRLESIKTGLEVAEKGGGLALKAAPYLATLWQLLVAWHTQSPQ